MLPSIGHCNRQYVYSLLSTRGSLGRPYLTTFRHCTKSCKNVTEPRSSVEFVPRNLRECLLLGDRLCFRGTDVAPVPPSGEHPDHQQVTPWNDWETLLSAPLRQLVPDIQSAVGFAQCREWFKSRNALLASLEIMHHARQVHAANALRLGLLRVELHMQRHLWESPTQWDQVVLDAIKETHSSVKEGSLLPTEESARNVSVVFRGLCRVALATTSALTAPDSPFRRELTEFSALVLALGGEVDPLAAFFLTPASLGGDPSPSNIGVEASILSLIRLYVSQPEQPPVALLSVFQSTEPLFPSFSASSSNSYRTLRTLVRLSLGTKCNMEDLQETLQDIKAEIPRCDLLYADCCAVMARKYAFNYVYFSGLFQAAIGAANAWLRSVEGITEAQRNQAINRLYRSEYVHVLKELGQVKEADALRRRYEM